MIDLLKKLCTLNGVSGNEREVLGFIADEISGYADELYFDNSGNLCAFKRGKKVPENRIMYAAHADEVGLMINHINEDGTLLFEPIGIDNSILLSKRVVIGKNKIPGVVSSKPIHLVPKDERKSAVPYENMCIDIGTNSKEESEVLGVYADYAAFADEFLQLSQDTVLSKALDDRFGCALLIKMIKSDLMYDSYFAFTVCEEIGTRGARSAAANICPDIAVIVESTTAADIYGICSGKRVCSLGAGAVIPFADRGTIYSKKLLEYAKEVAEKENIKIQTKTYISGGTDARTIQRTGAGTHVLGVSLACRYIHSPNCMASISDMREIEKLLFALSETLPNEKL